jgi:DNA-binding transcriptional regulator YiaG
MTKKDFNGCVLYSQHVISQRLNYRSNSMSTAEVIKKIRMTLCLEQKEFGELLGISYSSVSHYETSIRQPRLPVIRKLLELCKKHKIKVSIEDFLSEG